MEQKIIQTIRDGFSPEKNTEQALKSLSNSVKILADDLYAKDTHFIFELIQNAEDNDYAIEAPSLKFSLSETDLYGNDKKLGLLVENNEDGFQKDHVKAICAVGESTKDKNKGYIGEKGIGFKSVFRVTSCPLIFSNGYRFSLPQKDESTNLGYIVPYWHEEFPTILDHQKTNIYLPLDQPDFPKEKIIESLQDIAPETIIFLNKLKTIEIEVNLEEHYEIIIEKDDSNFPIVKLTYLKKNSEESILDEKLFWVYSKEYLKPVEIVHEKRPNVESRTVSVAIPLSGSKTGKLFAYLPVWESTGVPFLINADFLLVSSREGVKEDEPWNLWLRSCIPEVYCEALLGCLNSKKLTFEERIQAYASIPMETLQPFLQPLINETKDQLQKIKCIYAAPDNTLFRPLNTRIASNFFWDLVGSDEQLPVALLQDVRLVSKKISPFYSYLQSVGVEKMNTKELIDCLDDYNWLVSKSDDWLLMLYKYLDKCKIGKPSLASKSIVRIESLTKEKNLSCDIEQPIYFVCDNEARKIINSVPRWLKKIIPIEFLDQSFFNRLSKQENYEEIKELMTKILNVNPFSIRNYCIDILNTLRQSYEDLSPDQIIDATGFLVQHSIDDISWNKLPIILKNEEIKILYELGGRSVLVPPKYDDNTGWQNIWVENKEKDHFLVLSDEYPNDMLNRLIALCGKKIRRYPDPQKIDRNEQLLNDYEKTISLKAPRSTKEKKITNYRSPSILRAESLSDTKSAFSILSFISNNLLSDYTDAYVHYFYRTSYRSRFDSEIFFNLKNCKWLPSSKGFVKPSQAFIPKKEIKEILGDTVPYLCEVELDDKSIELLEIKTELTLSKLIEALKAYSGDPTVNSEMVSIIYSEIDARTKFNEESRIETIDEFTENQLIFVRGEDKIGKWCSIGDVLWENAENVLGKDFIYIENFYPKLKEFFVETLKIKEKADPESFANRWLKLQEKSIQNEKDFKQVMEDIYRVLLPVVKEEKQLRPEWWDDFTSEALILTQDLSFETNRNIVVPDDGELKKIFSKSEIKYAWRPEKDSFNQWVPFYEAFEIPRISRSVTIDLSEDTEIKIKSENEFITNSVILMIATWLREREFKYYIQLQKDNFFDELIKIKETITLDTINIRFRLETEWVIEDVESEYPIYWDREDGVIIINKNVSKSQVKRKISSVVAKGIMNNRAYKDLATWIEVILGAQNIERINDLSWSIPNEIKQKIKKIEKENIESKKKIDEIVIHNPKSNNDSEEEYKESIASGKKLNKNIESNPKSKKTNSEDVEENNHEIKEDPSDHSEQPESQPDNSQPEQKERSCEEVENEVDENDCSVPLNEIFNKFIDAFNQDGEISIKKEFEDLDYYNDGKVKNPSGRREKSAHKHGDRFDNEPNEVERRKNTMRSMLEPPDPATRVHLLNLYGGRCQICGSTFPQRNGSPFFIVGHIVERKFARALDNHANAICFCPKHFAQWRHGTKKTVIDIGDQILLQKTKKEGAASDPQLKINLCGVDCNITFKEKHMTDLKALLDYLTDPKFSNDKT